ncbi:MAG TPA: asparagine synthase (glutamine-hydrolyzing) [Anaerovoracaceae bacterium]|nr:asparagine synthase (glutamine-hydrolyzing) [Anaerovoracaceae bacterium]
MCGIVGWTDFSRDLSNETDILRAMADKLANRGPDASGYWFSAEAALGHRRLVVVDPEGGKQPMVRRAGDNEYVLVYNGELYNTEDIRRELLPKGYIFEGWSDTEVLLNAYIEWGEGCVEKLNGIYAFAVWDVKRKELFLARDRIGVKPLFYSRKGGSFLFASEIKAILAHPMVSPKINREGLAEVFALGPARTPGHGVFSGINELKPGYCMKVGKNGYEIRQYWTLNSHSHEEDFEHTVAAVHELVYDSIKRQLVSDVPLCTLLSGGLDSSAITAVAAEVYRNEKKDPIRSFSIDYVGNDKFFRANEFQPNPDAPWAEKVSEYLGTRHSVCYIDTPELAESIFPAVFARDLPGMTDVDSSLLLFSRWIKERATVGLSGECADEVFGGYPWFYRDSGENAVTFPWTRRLNEKLKLFSAELLNAIRPERYVEDRYREALVEVPRYKGDSPEEARKRELFYLNLTRWMPTLLDRKDRMSMATGLELRVPFCDHRVVEYMWNVPWTMKYYRDREKGLLRYALTGMLPEDVLWRKKSPYPKTHNPSYVEAMSGLTLALLDREDSPLFPFINKKAVREFALSLTRDTNIPWFGQLMNAPQLLAYLLQIDFWMREYHIIIE